MSSESFLYRREVIVVTFVQDDAGLAVSVGLFDEHHVAAAYLIYVDIIRCNCGNRNHQ